MVAKPGHRILLIIHDNSAKRHTWVSVFADCNLFIYDSLHCALLRCCRNSIENEEVKQLLV